MRRKISHAFFFRVLPIHTWPRVEIKGGDEFSKNFLTPGGGPRVGMIFNPRGGRG